MATIRPPAAEMPVSLAEAKAYLRIADSDEDAILAGLLRTATELCEAFTGLTLLRRDVEETLAASSCWTRLGATPVQAITGAAMLGEGGAETALDPAAYAVDIDSAGDGWIRMTSAADPSHRVRVSYRAGLAADWNGIPEALRQGIVRLTADLYAHRQDDSAAPPPAAVAALWRPWRRIRLG